MPPEPADMRADDGAIDRADRNSSSALCALLWEDICRAASFKAENSFVSTSHWLLPQTGLRHDEDAALFPGGGEDRYGRGGPSEGRLSCQPPRVYGGVGRPGLSTLAWAPSDDQMECADEVVLSVNIARICRSGCGSGTVSRA